jgi:hypothetical protein
LRGLSRQFNWIAAGKLDRIGVLPSGGPSLRRDQADFDNGDVEILANDPFKDLIMRSWVDQKISCFGTGIVKPWRTGSDTDIEDRSTRQAAPLRLDVNR